jgi:hypothetical protein
VDILVKVCDAAALGYCAKGRRKLLAQHGLNYLEFVRHGFPAEVLLALNDDMANRVVEQAKKRIAQENA